MEKKVILFQGDSITDCCRDRNYAFDLAKGYPNLVMATLNMDEPYTYTAYNRGISGDRIADLYARIRKDMINLKPDYISILVGINEVWHGYAYDNGADEKKFEMIYGLLIEELQRELPGVKIFAPWRICSPLQPTRSNTAATFSWSTGRSGWRRSAP